MEMYRDPSLAAMLAKEGGEIARELVHALALSDDPPSMLRGRLGRQQARGLGRAAGPRGSEGRRPRLRLHGQRRADGRGRRRAARLHARTRRRHRRHDPARHGAGQPAPARAREETRQPFRSGIPRAAGRRGQPGAPTGTRRRLHEPVEKFAASHRCVWAARGAWRRAVDLYRNSRWSCSAARPPR